MQEVSFARHFVEWCLGVVHTVHFLAQPYGFTDSQLKYLEAEGQTRVFWGETPVDLFFNVSDLHQHMSLKTSQGILNGVEIPVLSAEFLAIFKVMFNRTKDWADLEAMVEEGSFNNDFVVSQLVDLLGAQDARIERLSRLVAKS